MREKESAAQSSGGPTQQQAPTNANSDAKDKKDKKEKKDKKTGQAGGVREPLTMNDGSTASTISPTTGISPSPATSYRESPAPVRR